MKKLLIASVVALISVSAIAQDTIPKKTPSKMYKKKDSLHRKSTDTTNWKKKDSTASNQQWNQDTLANKQWPKADTTTPPLADKQKTTNDLSTGTPATTTNWDSTKPTANTNLSDSSRSATASAGATQDTTAKDKSLSDRVMMKDDKMYIVQDGESQPLEKNYKLESGAVITTEGEVKYPSGKVVQLKNGQYIAITPKTDTDDSGDNLNKKKAPSKTSKSSK